MKRTFTRRLSLLLTLCLLLFAPAAMMETAELPEMAEGIEAPEAIEGIEAPVAELPQEIGEIAEASEEETVTTEATYGEAEEEAEDDGIDLIECMDGTICYVDRYQENARLVPVGGAAVRSYDSSNPDVARIDRTGLVIPEGFGRTDITITLKSGEVMTVYLGINGGGGRREGNWGFMVPTDEHLRMNVGDSLKLKFESWLSPEEGEITPIEWRTSDKTVATVSKAGVVKAKKPGSVEIEVDLKWPWGGGYAHRYIKVVDTDAKSEKGTAIDAKHFPDPAFREVVSFFYDLNEDGKLSKSEIASATRMVYHNDYMKSMAGIELLTGLKYMELCGMQNIASLDLSKNTELEHLFLEDPDRLTLKTLNLSKKANLTYLGIEHSGKMGYPDPSAFKKLEDVSVGDLGKVKSLDFSKNTALKRASIWENGALTSLKLSKLPKLVELEIESNDKLSTLDVTGNPALQVLSVVGNDKLKRLDITGCTQLINLVNSVDPKVDEEDDEIIYESGSRELKINGDMTLTGEGLYPTLELSKNASYSAYAGETFRLTLAGAKAKGYKSSKTGVAKVSKNGVVTPVKAGKAIITVTLSNGKTRKLALTVLDPDAVTIAQGKAATLKLRGTLTLKAAVHNPATLTWSSSKPNVAMVNAKTGKVTAVTPGTATITVKTSKGKKAAIKITVTR